MKKIIVLFWLLATAALAQTPQYTYWNDGSLKSDTRRGISLIEYDTFLSKVKQVNFSDGRWIKYYWDGRGTLLRKLYSTGDKYDFTSGGMIYKNDKPYQMTLEGEDARAVYNQATDKWEIVFDYRDHRGDTRVSFKEENGQAKVVEAHDYDPFGVELAGINDNINNSTTTPNLYGFQNKLKDPSFTKWIDFGYRQYDPTIGRFLQIDPLADDFPSLSPYSYVGNNPINNFDPDGRECIGCPSDAQYDKYRNNKSLFTYDKETGIVLNGYAVTVYGTRRPGLDISGTYGRHSYLSGIIGAPALKNYGAAAAETYWSLIRPSAPDGQVNLPGTSFAAGALVKAGKAISQLDELVIQFGKTENQIYHTFRHMDEIGLDKALVKSKIEEHFKTVASKIEMNKPFNQVIEVSGKKIQYTAFKLPDGKINIGRIHEIK